MFRPQNLEFSAALQNRLEPGDWDWTAISSIATATAAVVTAITIFFIFKQTRATRTAAEQAERSADAAFHALEYSQKQLDFAQRQHLQAMYMAAEAVKARIDADLPGLLLQAASVAPSANVDGDGNPVVYAEPIDDSQVLHHLIKFQIKNDGPRSAKLRYSEQIKYHTVDPTGQDSIQQITEAEQVIPLGAGHTLNGEYVVRRTIREWIDSFESRARGEASKAHQFTIRSLTDADTGANELHNISLSGTALVPRPQHRGAWIHRTMDDMKENLVAFIEPVERTYFLSRLRNERLPEIHWASFAETTQGRTDS